MITSLASNRIAQYAFQHARSNGRKRVTCVHKANVMYVMDASLPAECGPVLSCLLTASLSASAGSLWTVCSLTAVATLPKRTLRSSLRRCSSTRPCSRCGASWRRASVRDRTPQLNSAVVLRLRCWRGLQMASDPKYFDVMVMPNLYGDIISDLGAPAFAFAFPALCASVIAALLRGATGQAAPLSNFLCSGGVRNGLCDGLLMLSVFVLLRGVCRCRPDWWPWPHALWQHW